MGRLYSGNLNDFKGACNRLHQLDFVVISEERHDVTSRQECIWIRIEDRAGNILAQDSFRHYDEDVLCNTVTSWLNRIATQLSTWSKYQ